jgi:S1-C subfamily serine protease
VGNAGGTGGTPTAAPGTISALDQEITAGDETGTSSEQLSGLIEVTAAVQAGDSGGPLFAGGVVIGIDTAANSGGTTGFAIPATTATVIADRIAAGEQSSTIHQGTPAFLGVELSDTASTRITGVTDGSAAASLGLAGGDTINAIDGTTVTSGQTLSTAVSAHRPGARVAVSWTDATGTSHTGTATLGAGPAD